MGARAHVGPKPVLESAPCWGAWPTCIQHSQPVSGVFPQVAWSLRGSPCSLLSAGTQEAGMLQPSAPARRGSWKKGRGHTFRKGFLIPCHLPLVLDKKIRKSQGRAGGTDSGRNLAAPAFQARGQAGEQEARGVASAARHRLFPSVWRPLAAAMPRPKGQPRGAHSCPPSGLEQQGGIEAAGAGTGVREGWVWDGAARGGGHGNVPSPPGQSCLRLSYEAVAEGGSPGSQHHSLTRVGSKQTPFAERSGCPAGFGVHDQVHVGEGHGGVEAAASPKAVLRR